MKEGMVILLDFRIYLWIKIPFLLSALSFHDNDGNGAAESLDEEIIIDCMEQNLCLRASSSWKVIYLSILTWFFFFSFLIILLFLVWYRLQMVNTAVRIKRIQLLKDNFNVVCVTAITKCFLKSWPQSFYPVENSKKSDWSVNASYPVSSAYLPCGA